MSRKLKSFLIVLLATLNNKSYAFNQWQSTFANLTWECIFISTVSKILFRGKLMNDFVMAAAIILLQNLHCNWGCFRKESFGRFSLFRRYSYSRDLAKTLSVNLFPIVNSLNLSCSFVPRIFIACSFFWVDVLWALIFFCCRQEGKIIEKCIIWAGL